MANNRNQPSESAATRIKCIEFDQDNKKIETLVCDATDGHSDKAGSIPLLILNQNIHLYFMGLEMFP